MKRLALLGIGCYFLALLIAFPPALALRWLAPKDLSMQSPAGSVWRGETQAASYAGYYLGSAKWRMQPLALLRGRLAYEVEAQAPDGFIKGVFALTPTGKLHVSKLSAVAAIQTLAPLLPPELPAGLVKGRAQLKLDELQLADGWPLAARGQVDLVDLEVMSGDPLGSYEIQLDGDDGAPVHGTFHDTAGTVEIKGTLTLNADRSSDLQCTAHPRPNASDMVKSAVGSLCRKS
jgi:hypothetical protein